MQTEYIRKEDAVYVINCKCYELKGLAKNIIKGVQELPPADVAPVVRCKDCIHRDPEDKKCDCGHGIVWQLPRDDNWFCADGERREE